MLPDDYPHSVWGYFGAVFCGKAKMGIHRRDRPTSRTIVILELMQQGNRGRHAVVWGVESGTGRYFSQRALIIYAFHAAVYSMQRGEVNAVAQHLKAVFTAELHLWYLHGT